MPALTLESIEARPLMAAIPRYGDHAIPRLDNRRMKRASIDWNPIMDSKPKGDFVATEELILGAASL